MAGRHGGGASPHAHRGSHGEHAAGRRPDTRSRAGTAREEGLQRADPEGHRRGIRRELGHGRVATSGTKRAWSRR